MKYTSLLLIASATAWFSCSKSDKPGAADPDKMEIVSFTPDQGLIGDTITLKGKNFSTYPTSNHVSFAGELPNAEVLAASSPELTLKIPPNATTGKITVRVGSRSAVSATDFIVLDDQLTVVTDFTPKSGTFGTVVTVKGRNLGTDLHVSIDGVPAAITQKSATQFVFIIPGNISLTSHKLIFVSDGFTFRSLENFTVTQP
jgi:hypothetical protein